MIPVLTKEQAYQLDKDTIENDCLSQEKLMDNAGKKIAQFFCERIKKPFNQKVLIACGKGNNGGDGIIAHSYLKYYGVSSEIIFTEKKCGHSELLKKYKIPKSDYSAYNDKAKFDQYDWIIDGIFGIGFSRTVTSKYINMFEKINLISNVISIDIPSGIYVNAESFGTKNIKAKHTLALGAPKIGSYFFENRNDIGNMHILDIGLKNFNSTSFVVNKNYVKKKIKNIRYKNNITKYDKVASIYAGSDKYPGAAIFACNAAFKAGSGYINIQGEFTDKTSNIIESNCSEAVLNNQLKYDNLLIGPGLNKNFNLQLYLSKTLPNDYRDNTTMIIDASALNSDCINLPEIYNNISFIRTPHLDELIKMFNLNSDISYSLFELIELIRNSSNNDDITILKGPSTFIIADDIVYIIDNAPSLLATAGTGDVLSGILVSLLSQGYSRLEAALLGTYLHAESANYYIDNISKDGMTASDLINCIPPAFNILRENYGY